MVFIEVLFVPTVVISISLSHVITALLKALLTYLLFSQVHVARFTPTFIFILHLI